VQYSSYKNPSQILAQQYKKMFLKRNVSYSRQVIFTVFKLEGMQVPFGLECRSYALYSYKKLKILLRCRISSYYLFNQVSNQISSNNIFSLMVGYNVAIIPYLYSLSCVMLDGTCHQRTWRHTGITSSASSHNITNNLRCVCGQTTSYMRLT